MCNPTPIISISPDAMKADLRLVRPNASGKEQPAEHALIIQAIENELEKAGVLLPPEKGLLENIVEAYRAGKEISGITVVHGKPARPGLPAKIAQMGDLKLPVFPGDTFGRLIPARPPRSGMDVRGKVVYPPDTDGNTKKLTPNIAESVLEKNGALIARRYGLVAAENNEIKIIPLLELGKDLMSLTATVYHKDFLGRDITREHLLAAVKALGLKARVNKVMLEESLGKAVRTGAPVFNVQLCSGIRPFRGEDGWVEILTMQKQERLPGKIGKGGNIDYKQRGVIETVKKDDIVARIHPPTKGRPGRNLMGEAVAPEEGLPAFINLGENVTQRGNDIVAVSGGLLIRRENEIFVSEVYAVNGDVGPHTGHVTLDRGSVQIEGSVISGFKVNCPGNILVKKTVEDSILTAGGDMDIDSGIMMNGSGMIWADGSVRALFAIGTNIYAGQDVYIMNEVNKSKIIAEGRIIVAGGQGKVVGGLLHCGKGIQATQVGSEFGVATCIRLGIDQNFVENYKSELFRLSHALNNIRKKVGDAPDEEIMARYPATSKTTIQHILTLRKQLHDRARRLESAIARIERQLRQNYTPALKVEGIIYPGTTIQCGTKEMTVHAPLSQSKIYFDASANEFKISNL